VYSSIRRGAGTFAARTGMCVRARVCVCACLSACARVCVYIYVCVCCVYMFIYSHAYCVLLVFAYKCVHFCLRWVCIGPFGLRGGYD